MSLYEGNPFKTCANPQAHDQNVTRANLYENEMVLTYRDLNCSGASPKFPPGNPPQHSEFPRQFPKQCWGIRAPGRAVEGRGNGNQRATARKGAHSCKPPF